jgi:thymidylate synthase (FAD)
VSEPQQTNFNVELVTITPQAERIIGVCARVSNPANQDKPFDRLLAYMIENKHWSPFEMANMVIEIETSRAISAQILRHRSFSFQEFSQRYAEVQEFQTYPARRKDEKNRQSSIDDLSEHTRGWFDDAQYAAKWLAERQYAQAIAMGIAKEQARFLLPMSSKTRLYMNGTIRSWIHYLELRTGNGTQLEHQEIARAIQEIFKAELPVVSTALGWA